MPTIRIPPVLRPEAGGNRHVEAEGRTVRELLENLVESYPSLRNRVFEGDELPQFLNIFIDGTDVRLNEGLETRVDEGAVVILLPAVAGGQAAHTSADALVGNADARAKPARPDGRRRQAAP